MLTNLKITINRAMPNITKVCCDFTNCSNPMYNGGFFELSYPPITINEEIIKDIRRRIDSLNACYQLASTLTIAEIQLRDVCYIETYKQQTAKCHIETLFEIIDSEIINLANNFKINGFQFPEFTVDKITMEEIQC